MNLTIRNVILALLITFTSAAKGQTGIPRKIAFQSLIRDNANNLVRNTTVGCRFSVLKGSLFGASVYVESQSLKTNINGLLTVNIGEGNVVVGDFAQINWLEGPYFLKTELDPLGGSSYTLNSVTEMLSVPYALAAIKSDTANFAKTANELNCLGCIKLENLQVSDIQSILKDSSSVNEIQTLSLRNDSLLLSRDGGAVKIPDSDATNELQSLSRNFDTLRISKGNYVRLPDIDSLNEIQQISKKGDTITLNKNGSFIKLTDDDTLNEIQQFLISHDTLRLSKSKRYVILGNKEQDTLNGVISSLGDATYSGTYAVNMSSTFPSNVSSFIDLSCNIDLGSSTWILGVNNHTPIGLLNFRTSNNTISLIRNINSSIRNSYLDMDKTMTSDAKDTSFIWFGDGKFIIYKAKTDSYYTLPKGTKHSAFFNNLTISETPSLSQNQVLRFSKSKDTLLIAFQKGDISDFHYYLYHYLIKSDSLIPIDSIELTMRNGTKCSTANVVFNGVNQAMIWGDFKANSLSNRFSLSNAVQFNFKTKKRWLTNIPPYPIFNGVFQTSNNYALWNNGLSATINSSNGLIKSLNYSKQLPQLAQNGNFTARSTTKNIGNLIKSNGKFYLLGTQIPYANGETNGYLYLLNVK